MDTIQLIRALKSDRITNQCLGDVVPWDYLPSVVLYPSVFITNTDDSSRGGSHWTAFYFNDLKEGEFFDSFGNPPEFYGQPFKRFLNRNSISYIYNNMPLQSDSTTVCGQYCLFYCLHRCRGISMHNIVRSFTENTLINDALVYDFIAEKHNVNVPIVDLEFVVKQASNSIGFMKNK